MAEPSGRVATDRSGRVAAEPSGRVAAEPSGRVAAEPSGRVATDRSGRVATDRSGRVAAEPSRHPRADPSRRARADPSVHPGADPSGRAGAEPLTAPPASTPPAHDRAAVEVAVIGAGIVGLGIAWAAVRSGRTVAVIDPAPANGATYAAAGMLAPVSELHYEEEDLLELTLASAARYPAFVAPLEPGTGYLSTSTLVVAADAADRRALDDLASLQRTHGLSVEAVSIRAARAGEPLLSANIAGAFVVDDDHQVDPRRLADRLRDALTDAGAVFVSATAAGLLHENADPDRVTGVRLTDGRRVTAREVIVANGLGAAQLTGLPAGLDLPLRPVYGDILRLRVPEQLRPLITATVRGVVRGLPVYLVPREDGTIVIGATSREDGVPGVSAGGVHQLLRDAQVLVPTVSELELIEATARARPGTPDNAPLLGRVRRDLDGGAGSSGSSGDSGGSGDSGDIPGLIIATGFFRHGVLLTPIAAEICVALLDGTPTPQWTRFRPDRFPVRTPLPRKETVHA